MSTVARCHALSHLVRMTAAEHLVMQNEAVIALTILVTVLTGLDYDVTQFYDVTSSVHFTL